MQNSLNNVSMTSMETLKSIMFRSESSISVQVKFSSFWKAQMTIIIEQSRPKVLSLHFQKF